MRKARLSSPLPGGPLLKRVQVNLPFPMLVENLDAVLAVGLQPEIYFNGATLDRLSAAEVEKTSAALRGKGIPVTFHAPFMDLNPGAVDERVREITALRFEQVFRLVPHFQPRAIVFHPGYDRWRYDDDLDLWRESSLLTWKPLVKKAEAMGAKLALENVFDHNPEPLRIILEEINSPSLGYCMDAGHGNLFSEVPLVNWIEILGPRLWEIHLHDNHGKGDDHLPLGRGNIDFSALFSRLKEKRIQPIYTIEPHEIGLLQPSLEALEKYLPD